LRHETQQIQGENGQPPESPFIKGDLSAVRVTQKIPLRKGGAGVVTL